MPCSTHYAFTNAFTEEDLACDSLTAPPTRIDLRLVKAQEDDSSDILADLEAVTPRIPPPQPLPLADLAFDTSSPQRDVLAAHLLRRTASQTEQHVSPGSNAQPVDWPCLPRFARRPSEEKAVLTSPTDVTWCNFLGPDTVSTPVSSRSLPSPKKEPVIKVMEESSVLDDGKLDLSICQGVKKLSVCPGVKKLSVCPGVKKRASKPRHARKSATPQPSRFCHICARTQKSRKMFCANLNTEKKCRKAVCEPCFRELKWDFAKALEGKDKWHCPHCRGMCSSVPRARCHIYTKTNEKRKALKRS